MSAKRVGRGCEMVGERVDIYGWLQLHYLRPDGDKKWERLCDSGLISVDGYSYIT